jgi:antitoxin HicB
MDEKVVKDLDYYLRLPYRVEIYPEPDGSGYTAEFPDLPGCITCADTWDELMEMIEDAKAGWLEIALEDGDPIPDPPPPEEDKLTIYIPRSLYRRLAERARQENINLNQFVTNALAQIADHS